MAVALRRAALVIAFLGLGMTALPGCLVASSSQTSASGVQVPESTYEQIKPGTTTVGWVKATLGDPSAKTNAGGDEVWKYIYTQRTDSSGAIFLVFAGSNTSTKTGTVYIEFRDGVVVNKWRA